MRRLLPVALFLLPCVFAQQAYSPTEVTSADDVYTPYNVVFDGLFVLDVGIGDDGNVRGIEFLRNPGSMPVDAKSSLQNWKFQPASEDGKTKASRMTVAFVYRPGNNQTFGAASSKEFTPVNPSASSDDIGYVPVGILSFAYPEYPINSVASGSVVLQATVDSTGDVKSVKILHPMAGFDGLAQAALRKWRFSSATLHGKAVTSKVVLAFIFQSPPSSN
jgi:TonB family protein